jgi:hypothetical protein
MTRTRTEDVRTDAGLGWEERMLKVVMKVYYTASEVGRKST